MADRTGGRRLSQTGETNRLPKGTREKNPLLQTGKLRCIEIPKKRLGALAEVWKEGGLMLVKTDRNAVLNQRDIESILKRLTSTKAPKKKVPYYLEDRWPNVVIRESHGHPFKIKL